MKYTLKDIGRFIREAREVTGMSLTDFANRIGEDKSNLSKIERGELNIKLDRFLKIIDQVPIYFRKTSFSKTGKTEFNIQLFEKKINLLELGNSIEFTEEEFRIKSSTARQTVHKIKKESNKIFSTRTVGEKILIIRIK